MWWGGNIAKWGQYKLISLEDEGTAILWNVRNYLPPRRLCCSASLLLGPRIPHHFRLFAASSWNWDLQIGRDASCVTVCTLWICVLWDVTLCRWMSGSFLVDYVTLSMKALQSFETSWTICLTTQHHILKDSDPQKHHCENFISHICTLCFVHWHHKM
jgi:hypothetical protein